MPSTIEAYLKSGLPTVKGYLPDGSGAFIATLSSIQRELGHEGSVGEIGVHQGRLFIVLALTKSDKEHIFAIDMFENDEINTAQKSLRSIEILKGHLAKWAPNVTNLKIIKNNSTAVKPNEVFDTCGPVRLFSIDGGHDEVTVESDLNFAEAVMAPNGVVIIDDYFSEGWPGVSAAVTKYLMSPRARYHPFAISPGKLYLAQPDTAKSLRERLMARYRGNFVRTEAMFGHPVDIYFIRPPLTRRLANRLKTAIG